MLAGKLQLFISFTVTFKSGHFAPTLRNLYCPHKLANQT